MADRYKLLVAAPGDNIITLQKIAQEEGIKFILHNDKLYEMKVKWGESDVNPAN